MRGTNFITPHCTQRCCVKKHIDGLPMVAGDKYRGRALELLARAEGETHPEIRAELENLAAAFLRLAEQAERNTKLAIEFEIPPEESGDTKPKS